MFPLLARRQKALFWREAPSAVFAVLVKLPLGVIFGFLLLAFVVTLAGHPGAELAADGLLNALAFVGLAQGSILLGVALVTVLCFIDSVWRVRAALWPIAAGLFAKTPALMQVWRTLWTCAPTVPTLSSTHRFEYEPPVPGRKPAGAFTPGLTPQLE